jgi:hypothetical protein
MKWSMHGEIEGKQEFNMARVEGEIEHVAREIG